MISVAILIVVFAALLRLSSWAAARFSTHSVLPMQFGLDGSVGWTLRRDWALMFMPLLSAFILIPTALTDPGPGLLIFVGACCVAGHGLHIWLIDRAVRGGGT